MEGTWLDLLSRWESHFKHRTPQCTETEDRTMFTKHSATVLTFKTSNIIEM